MANKKITVVGDGAEQPLTPEEEHRLEVRVDQMMDPNAPDSQTTAAETTDSKPESAEPAAGAAAPKVTKILTKFADDDVEPEVAKPAKAEAKKPELVITPPSSVVEENPKPAAKKIAIKHHDEEDEEPAAKKPVAKKTKTKAPAKKGAKKFKVTIADGSEPADLKSQADAIAAAALAAEKLAVTKQKTEVEPLEPAPVEEVPEEPVIAKSVEAAAPEQNDNDRAETTDDTMAGAPPLIQKHTAAPIGASEAAPELESELPKPPSVTKKISVLHDDAEAEPAPLEEPAETEVTEPLETVDVLGEPEKKVTEITVSEPPEEAEAITVDVEPQPPETPTDTSATDKAEPSPVAATAPDTKKYRPPEGPIQFKRAEVPIQPHKPGEPRPAEAPDASELSEDEAIAQAFEEKDTSKGVAVGTLVAGLVKLLKWTLILAIIAGVIAVGVMPNLRHKALGLVGLNKSPAKTTPAGTASKATSPVSTVQDVYVADRAGTYNIYRAAADGKQEQLVLAGTGSKPDAIALAPDATATYAALVSTRDGKKNADGELQQSIAIVTVATGSVRTLDTADTVKLIDWYDTRLVYVLFNASTSTTDSSRYQILSYNTSTKTRTVLDHVSYLNDIVSAKGLLYYATASNSTASGQFASMKPDGTDKKVIESSEITTINRIDYDQLVLSAANKWNSYMLGSAQPTQTNNVPQSGGLHYVDSPDAKKTVYITKAGALTLHDVATGKETTLTTAGASYPIHWLGNDTIVYRSAHADYSLSASGGQPTKIAEVADVPGISLWYEK